MAYETGNWWHNYQIYRKSLLIFDNKPNRHNTPCFTFLPWHKLKKGDRIELEIWSKSNYSSFLAKEEIVTYIKTLEKVRDFRIKIIERDESYWALVWYYNKFQTFSVLTALRFAGEDNWNTHYPIVQFVNKYLNKAHVLKLIGMGHVYVKTCGVAGNFHGHALCPPECISGINTTKELKKAIEKNGDLNVSWKGTKVKVFNIKKNYEDICSEWGIN